MTSETSPAAGVPTPPVPLPAGRGEKGRESPELLPDSPTASSSPLPAGRGAGGVGLEDPRRRRKRLAALVAAVGLVAFGIWYFAIRTPEPRDDFGRFQGEWQLAVPAGTRDNQPTARRVASVTIRVTGDRWVWLVGEKEQRRYQMTLRPEANPKEIDLTQLGPDDQPTKNVLQGIYTIEGDYAKVLTAPNSDPRPTSLDNAEGPPGWLMERVK